MDRHNNHLRAFVCSAHETLDWADYENAPLTGRQVRVRHEFAAEKHGTMMEFFKGQGNQRGTWDSKSEVFHQGKGLVIQYPISLGNMAVGRIETTGPEAKERQVGERVLIYAGFRPISTVDEQNCWVLNENVSWKTAVCLDPASYALAAVRDGHLRLGDSVAIFGMGAIGLMCVQLARLAGAYPIIALDPSERRRELSLRTGATHAADPVTEDAGLAIRQYTGGRGADVVIEYSGAMEAMQAALRGVAFGGNVVAGAFPPPYKAGLDLGAEAHMNRPNILFSRIESQPDRDHPRWNLERNRETVMHLIRTGQINGDAVVEPVIPFDSLLDSYLPLVTDKNGSVKLGVSFPASA